MQKPIKPKIEIYQEFVWTDTWRDGILYSDFQKFVENCHKDMMAENLKEDQYDLYVYPNLIRAQEPKEKFSARMKEYLKQQDEYSKYCQKENKTENDRKKRRQELLDAIELRLGLLRES